MLILTHPGHGHLPKNLLQVLQMWSGWKAGTGDGHVVLLQVFGERCLSRVYIKTHEGMGTNYEV